MARELADLLGWGHEAIKYDLWWDDYVELPFMNPSTLVHGLKSLRHLKHAWEHPQDDTDDLRWGRAVHCLLFEPKQFELRYAAWEGRRAGNAWQEFTERCTAHNMEILTQKQLDSAVEASRSFIDDPQVQRLIDAGQAEVTLMTVEDGIQCKGRLDWIRSSKPIVDLKTSKDITARAFGRDFYKYKYDVKLGLYQRWLDRLTGDHWPVEIICLEKEPPYDVTVVPIPDAVLERGARKGLAVIAQLKAAIGRGEWPGIAGGDVFYLDTPTYEMDSDELEGAEVYA